jgi:hypothetical protein
LWLPDLPFWGCQFASQEIDMQTRVAVLCLALLLGVEPAGAQQVYSLTVSIHKDLPPLTETQADDAFQRASDLLKEGRNQCGLTLKRSGSIGTFDSAPKKIMSLDDLEAVHRVPADVKIVESIHFCMGKFDKRSWWGCSWRPEGLPKTVIVARGLSPGPVFGRDLRYILWAHEFGHTRGLHHRVNDKNALMTPCDIADGNRHITKDECTCYKDGPGGCPIPPPKHEPACSARRQ